jgi:Ankyrin repeats (3 copies)
MNGSDQVKHKVAWLAGTDNPWKVRLLDVRGITLEMMSTTRDPTCAENAISFFGDDGTSFIGQEPATPRVSQANLRFPIDRYLADGVLFTPSEMEHKWALFYHGGQLICVRSWTRRVQVVAQVEVRGDSAELTRVRGTFLTDDEEPEFTVRALDYLVRTHALQGVCPAPLPTGMEADANMAATWCMSAFGNRAWYATPDPLDGTPPATPLRSHSLLHIGVARGDQAMIEHALTAGVPVDLLGPDGLSPLHWALANEDTAPMALLLKRGSPVDVRSDEGATPLMSAAQSASLAQVMFLLDHGADVNAVDKRGFAALHRTAELGHLDLVTALLERGAAVSLRAGEHTPLSLALAQGQGPVAALLKRRGGT